MAPVLYSSVAPLKKRGSAASSIMTKSSSSSVTPTSMYSFTRLYFACSRAHWLPTFLHRDHVGWCVVSFSLSILKKEGDDTEWQQRRAEGYTDSDRKND